MERPDPMQDFLQKFPRNLDPLFFPRSVALIGAKEEEGSVGHTLLTNLLNPSFKGNIYPVNPKRKTVLGKKCYPSILSIPEEVDLVIVVTPAKTVPLILKECAEKKVRGAIVISAGFKEKGEEGRLLEEEIVKIAKEGGISLIGPNCLGIMNPLIGLNATFAKGMAHPGNIAFISQSGAMCTAVLDWSLKEKIGFSSFVSLGSQADVGFGDLVDYLGSLKETSSLLLYMETINDARSFLSAVKEISYDKPVIVIKPGKSAEGQKATLSHTGSLSGSDAVFDAALERVGGIRVDSIRELFQLASLLSKQPKPKGPHLAIITNAGGPAVLATDALSESGGKLFELPEALKVQLNKELPDAWSKSNPIDVLGDASPERYKKVLTALSKEEGVDGFLVIVSPQDVTDPVGIAKVVEDFSKENEKPILASWMGGVSVEEGREALIKASIPQFDYPDEAARAFSLMWKYTENLKLQYTIPYAFHGNFSGAKEINQQLNSLREKEKYLLDETLSKEILVAIGFPMLETKTANTEQEAVEIAKKIEFPVVLKLFSETITHKSDVGGVLLNITTEEGVRKAFKEIQSKVPPKDFQGVSVQKMIPKGDIELILGQTEDSILGKSLLFGLGGQFVEIFNDTVVAIAPLNSSLARRVIEKTKVSHCLKGVRGKKSTNLVLLEQLLVLFSRISAELPLIKEIEINPLVPYKDGFLGLDARIILYKKGEPIPELAIKPYPEKYKLEVVLKGHAFTFRAIEPSDEPLLIQFHKELSEATVRRRFFSFLSLSERIAHERLRRVASSDYEKEIALVVEEQKKIIGFARLSKISGTKEVVLVMTIIDRAQGKGIGSALLHHLLALAKKEGIQEVVALLHEENEGMKKLLEREGFKVSPTQEEHLIEARKKV